MMRIVARDGSQVSEVAQLMRVDVIQVIEQGFHALGLMLTVDQPLEFEQIARLAREFGFTAVRDGSGE